SAYMEKILKSSGQEQPEVKRVLELNMDHPVMTKFKTLYENAEVEDSIVMDNAKLINAGNIVDSIIGRGAIIEKNKSLPKGRKFIIGDTSWVRI
ncbi:MAG: hypothetical protein ACNYVW_07525, partial [Methanosarcinales archaeon]